MFSKNACGFGFRLGLCLCVISFGSFAPRALAAETAWENLLGDNYQELWRSYQEEGWPANWEMEDGVLIRTGDGGDVMTVGTYADFELELEWKISPGGNSGIMYRVSTGDEAPYQTGPEYQVLDDEKHSNGSDVSTSAGSLYGLYAREQDVAKPVGEWNQARIVVNGNHVEHWLNGKKLLECEMGSDDWNNRVKNSKFSEWAGFGKNRKGHIALQDHHDPVWYRNIRVRRLNVLQ